MQLLAINRLYLNPEPKYVTCNLSSWKILNQWTHNLSHINVQFNTKQSMLFLKQCALKTFAVVKV